MIHHRAQLGVYLRLNDIPLPPIYGPTADSPMERKGADPEEALSTANNSVD